MSADYHGRAKQPLAASIALLIICAVLALPGCRDRLLPVERRLKPERLKNPGGFLVRVARNLSLDYLKSRRKLSSFDELLESDHPRNPGNERSEREEIVQMEMEKLPTIYREVLELNLFCGYKLEEIAAMLDKTPDAIWARASRARTQLRHAVAAALDALEKNNDGN